MLKYKTYPYKKGTLMNWFNEDTKVYPTKMFVNYLPEVSEESSEKQTKGEHRSVASLIGGEGLDILLSLAPKAIDYGMEFLGKTLDSLAEDQAYPTEVKRNFDALSPAKLYLPRKITLVRGDFAPNKNMQGELFGDGEEKSYNQAILSANKELHIEIDLIRSQDKTAFYFQPSFYFYKGKNSQSEQIDEVALAFAFIKPDEVAANEQFKNFVHFKGLEPNNEYTFKSTTGYDHSYQSSWMTAPLEAGEPYTMVVKIIEIRKGNSFAKHIQRVYLDNKEEISIKLNEEAKKVHEKAKKELKEKPDEE